MNHPVVMVLILAVLLHGSVERGRAEGVQSGVSGYDRANVLLKDGIVFEAIHELEIFLTATPDHEEARMLLARSLYRVKREERSAEELSQVLRRNPDNMEARRMLTRIRVEIGQRLNRKDHDAVLRYARLCAIPESYDRAADYYRMALELDNSVQIHLEFARMLSWAGRYEESSYHYELFLKANPDNPDALAELGRVGNASGHFERAVSAFERSLALRPDDVATALDLARALIWSGREEEAIRRLKEMERKQAGGDAPLMLLASVARMQERTLDEYELLGRVVSANPEQADAVKRIRELETGSTLDVARLRGHLEDHPKDIDARRRLAGLYMSDARYSDAYFQFDMIHKAVPEDLEVLELMRQMRAAEMRLVMSQVDSFRHLRDEERNREIETLVEWLERNTGEMKARLHLADLYVERGDYGNAIVQYEWLQAAEPDNVQISQALSRAQALLKLQAEPRTKAADDETL